MKRILLSLMALVALVLITNTALAQEQSPIVGASYQYSVTGLTAGDTYSFSVSTSTSTSGGSVDEAITNASYASTVPAGGTVTATIVWSDENTPRYLWISVTGQATGTCSNERYISISPEANDFDATIIALGTSSTNTIAGWETSTTTIGSDCFEYADGYNLDDKSATTSDGSSYAFFKIIPTSNGANTWNITNLTIGSGYTYNYLVDGGSWTTTMPTNIAANTNVLVRILIPNVPAGTTANASFTATENVTGATAALAENDALNNSASFAVNPFPSLGTGATSIFGN